MVRKNKSESKATASANKQRHREVEVRHHSHNSDWLSDPHGIIFHKAHFNKPSINIEVEASKTCVEKTKCNNLRSYPVPINNPNRKAAPDERGPTEEEVYNPVVQEELEGLPVAEESPPPPLGWELRGEWTMHGIEWLDDNDDILSRNYLEHLRRKYLLSMIKRCQPRGNEFRKELLRKIGIPTIK